MMHGPGEILQGNVAPGAIAFNSWTVEPIATNVGGEPAVSLVPNLLISGILTILVSAVLIVWAAAFVGRRHGGVILILLSFVMLLVVVVLLHPEWNYGGDCRAWDKCPGTRVVQEPAR